MPGNGGSTDSQQLFDLLVDPTTRTVLEAVDEEPLSAKELANHCDVSGPTMYRRVNDMEEHELLTTAMEIGPNGNHFTVYQSNVEQVQIELDPSSDDILIDLTYRSSTDQFIDLWEGLKNQ